MAPVVVTTSPAPTVAAAGVGGTTSILQQPQPHLEGNKGSPPPYDQALLQQQQPHLTLQKQVCSIAHLLVMPQKYISGRHIVVSCEKTIGKDVIVSTLVAEKLGPGGLRSCPHVESDE